MLERRSALPCASPRAGKRGPQPLTIGEVRGFELLQVTAFADTGAALGDTVRSALGVELPGRMDAPSRAGALCVFKVGPERFWIVGPEDTRIGSSLHNAVPSALGSLTLLSHSRTRLFIDGPSAREVLSTGIALDLHADVFRCDACALTGLQDTPVLLHRTGFHRYELYVLRTYTEWIWDWLTDAALPFGYDIVEKSHSSMK